MSIESEIPVLPDSPTTAAVSESPSEIEPLAEATSVQLRVGTARHEGRSWKGFTDPFTKTTSVVVAHAEELLNGAPVKGQAPIRVSNIIPGNGKIDCLIEVEWDSPLTYRVKFLIAN
ncbi:hypothetical protein [Streptomyces umbrinus]|uniref:hypothetical protein n=1 Tax=Streptomyces umbrinus TaxID=67370 RepID=UPI00340F6D16